jgi:DNA-binding transcriptional LysR family regulator
LAFEQVINAALHYRVTHADLTLVLALVRGKSLSRAAELMTVDVSTVFRSIRKLEASIGSALFDKGRSGYLPTAAALAMAQRAEDAEQALQAAQIGLEQGREAVSGMVRLTCTEAVLQSLLLPALKTFMANYPSLKLEFNTSSSFANLSRRDADIALRLTHTPPEHLVGVRLATVGYRIAARPEYLQRVGHRDWAQMQWIGVDELLPDHPTVAWRRAQYPGLTPTYRCSSMLGVAQLVREGMGVAALPDFMLDTPGLAYSSEPLAGCDTALWLLTRADCRALRSVSTLFKELTRVIQSTGALA